MNDIITFAPATICVLSFILGLKIFARIEDLNSLETKLMTYAIEHFVRNETYADNHKALQDQMLQIHQDVSEVKNLLISIINNHRS